MIKVLVVGQTPPPYNGMALMIERLVNCKLADVELVHVRMAFSSHMNELGRVRFGKVLHLFGLIARIIYQRFASGARILYYPPAGPERVPMYRDVAILLATRWLFDKTVFHFHAGGISDLYDRLPRWQRWFFRKAYFDADAAIRLSKLNPEDGQRLKAKREYVIPYGIDDPFPGLLDDISDPNSVSAEPLQILYVGVLSEAKGVMVLVDACGKLAARGVAFAVELVGQWESDGFAERVKSRLRELNLEGRFKFSGMLTGEAKFAAFRRAGVFCFPTSMRSEALPVVLLEAAACGLPAVSTRWRGIPSIIDDGQTGLLVAINNADEVADCIERLAKNPVLRGVMSRAAPTLNLFAVGFPITLIFGLVILLAGLPSVQTSFIDLIGDALDLVRSLLRLPA
jgi:glycosyltransferase involved in cell wall biosynthesis